MWRNYWLSWLAYAVFVAFAIQLERPGEQPLNWMLAFKAAWTVVAPAVLLTLVWPLTGLLERRTLPPGLMLLPHAAAALTFSLFSNTLLWVLTGREHRPLAYWVWPFLYSVLVYSVVAVIFHLVRAGRAAQQQALAIEQARNLLTAAELNALRSKLNPHFLFNTLHSIIALTRKDASAAESALFRFSDMLRYVLDTEKNGTDRVTLADELAFVRDYLDLEALRLGERLHVEWLVDPDSEARTLPPLTLQPLVENSIKYAFNPRSQPGKLVIQAALEAAGQLVLRVRDDGPGADPAAVRAARGLGIRTVERRLQLEYGAEARFEIHTGPGAGFEVALSLPQSHKEMA